MARKHKKTKENILTKPAKKISLSPLAYCVIIISGLIIIFYFHLIRQQYFLWDDVLYQWYPFFSFIKDSLKIFKLPMWNPYSFAGTPASNDLILTFYPINWIFLFLNGGSVLTFYQVELMILFHLLLIGCFAFLVFKELGIEWQPSILGSIILVFSGYLSLRTIQITPIVSFAWSLLASYFFIRMLTSNKILDAIGGGLCFGFGLLGGHPQFLLYLSYALIVYYFYHAFALKKQSWSKWLMSSLVKLMIFFLIGAGIAMIQYYPTMKYVPYTLRESQTFAQTTDGSLLPVQLITILIPKFFGSITGSGTDSVFFWIAPAGHYYWESGIYLGILPIFLALFGVFYSPRKIKYAFLIISVLALLFALGKYFPLYKTFWHIIPGLNRFRFPVRFLSIYTFSTAILTTFGLEHFLLTNEKLQKQLIKFTKFISIFLLISIFIYILLATGVLKGLSKNFSSPEILANCLKQFRIYLVFLLLTWLLFFAKQHMKSNPTIFIILAVIISFIDLYQANHNFSKGTTRPDEYYRYTNLVKFLQEERKKEVFRIRARENGYMILKRNEGCLWKLELTEGLAPLSLARYWTFNVPLSRRDEILNCKYVIKVDTVQNRMTLIQNPKYLPRAFCCYNYLVVPNDSAVLDLLRSDSINLRQTVILEEQPQIPTIGPFGDDSVAIQNWQNDYIQVYVKTTAPGFLVLSEIFYPEWCAKIDGQPTKIYCADYLLRAVYVPEGEHTIEMYYSKRNITIGALISLITLIFAITIGLISYKKEKPDLHN